MKTIEIPKKGCTDCDFCERISAFRCWAYHRLVTKKQAREWGRKPDWCKATEVTVREEGD